MNEKQLKEYIRLEIRNILEADDAEKQKLDKQKQDLEKQKLALNQNKLDFQKKKEADDDRKQDQEREEEQDTEQEQDQESGSEEQKPNISFKSQGDFYKNTKANLNNLTLSNGDLLDDGEKHYVALAVQSAEGRFDKGFVKFLRKGKAGNVYGKDFSDDDINKIIEYVKFNELVR